MKKLSDYTVPELQTLFKCVARTFGTNNGNILDDQILLFWMDEIEKVIKEKTK